MALMSISGARPFGSVFGAEAARRLGVFGLGCDRRWGASAGCSWGGSFWKLRPGCRQCGCAAPVRSSRFWSRMRRSSFWEPAGRPVVKFRLFVANAPFPAIATEPPRLVANDRRAIVAAFASKVRAICVLSFYAYKLFSTLCAKPSYGKRSRPGGVAPISPNAAQALATSTATKYRKKCYAGRPVFKNAVSAPLRRSRPLSALSALRRIGPCGALGAP